MAKFEFNQWYQENRDELRRKRAMKYRLDPSFREKTKARSKDYYATNIRKNISRTAIVLDGKKYLTIGGLAKVIKRDPQTIRGYHKYNILPDGRRWTSRRWRIYSMSQVILLKKAFEMFNSGEFESLMDLKKYIYERW